MKLLLDALDGSLHTPNSVTMQSFLPLLLSSFDYKRLALVHWYLGLLMSPDFISRILAHLVALDERVRQEDLALDFIRIRLRGPRRVWSELLRKGRGIGRLLRDFRRRSGTASGTPGGGSRTRHLVSHGKDPVPPYPAQPCVIPDRKHILRPQEIKPALL